MPGDVFESGLEVRKAVLTPEAVERAFDNAGEFGRPLQELVTEYCWGAVWGRGGLDRRSRSILNLGMIAAQGRMHEFKLHVGGALRNGLTREEIQEIVLQIAAYCGFPAALEAMRAVQEVLADLDAGQ